MGRARGARLPSAGEAVEGPKSSPKKKSKWTGYAGEKKAKAAEKTAARSSSAPKPKGDGPARGHAQERPAFSFGAQLQSKIKEAASKMRASANKDLVSYSPNSILAVRAAHAKTPAKKAAGSTRSIGFSSPLPPGTLSPDFAPRYPRDAEEKAAREAPSRVSSIGHPPSLDASAASAARAAPTAKDPSSASPRGKAEAKRSRGPAELARSLKSSSGGGGTVMQSLYRRECERAGDFVDYMTGPSEKGGGEERGRAAREASSPESGEDDLELKLDQGRMRLFNSILSEILFRRRLEMMDVEEMIETMNTTRSILSLRPFTLLEIRPYLRKLDDDQKIFVVEDEGKMGVVYVI